MEFSKPVKTELTDRDELMGKLSEMEGKYVDLVWYSRSPHPTMIRETYSNLSEESIQSILNSQAVIEEKYPDDIDEYKKSPDWKHGFNSGMLAAVRYVMTANRTDWYPDEEFEGESPWGGIECAEELFPELDT